MNALRFSLCAGSLALALCGCSLPAAWVAGIAIGAGAATIAGEGSTAVHNLLTLHKDVQEAKAAIPEVKKEIAAEAAKVKGHVRQKRARILARIRSGGVRKFAYDIAHKVDLSPPAYEPDARPHIDALPVKPADPGIWYPVGGVLAFFAALGGFLWWYLRRCHA